MRLRGSEKRAVAAWSRNVFAVSSFGIPPFIKLASLGVYFGLMFGCSEKLGAGERRNFR